MMVNLKSGRYSVCLPLWVGGFPLRSQGTVAIRDSGPYGIGDLIGHLGPYDIGLYFYPRSNFSQYKVYECIKCP